GGGSNVDGSLGFGDATSSTIHVVQTSHFVISSSSGVSSTWISEPTIGNFIVVYTWAYASSGQIQFDLGSIGDNDGSAYGFGPNIRSSINACSGTASVASAVFFAPVISAVGDPHALAGSVPGASSVATLGRVRRPRRV